MCLGGFGETHGRDAPTYGGRGDRGATSDRALTYPKWLRGVRGVLTPHDVVPALPVSPRLHPSRGTSACPSGCPSRVVLLLFDAVRQTRVPDAPPNEPAEQEIPHDSLPVMRSVSRGCAVRVLREQVPKPLRSMFDGIVDPVDSHAEVGLWRPGSLGYDYAVLDARVHVHVLGFRAGPRDGNTSDHCAVIQRAALMDHLDASTNDREAPRPSRLWVGGEQGESRFARRLQRGRLFRLPRRDRHRSLAGHHPDRRRVRVQRQLHVAGWNAAAPTSAFLDSWVRATPQNASPGGADYPLETIRPLGELREA